MKRPSEFQVASNFSTQSLGLCDCSTRKTLNQETADVRE